MMSFWKENRAVALQSRRPHPVCISLIICQRVGLQHCQPLAGKTAKQTSALTLYKQPALFA